MALRKFLLGDIKVLLNMAINVACVMIIIWFEVLEQYLDESAKLKFWIPFAIITNFYFLVMLVLHFVAFDVTWVFTKKQMLILEIVLQVAAITADVLFFIDDYELQLMAVDIVCVVFLLRWFRMLSLLREHAGFNVLLSTFETFKNPSFRIMMLSFYLIYYWFVQIGMFFFSSIITSKSVTDQGLYYLMNFNDYAMSLNTLFQIMVGNNWQ